MYLKRNIDLLLTFSMGSSKTRVKIAAFSELQRKPLENMISDCISPWQNRYHIKLHTLDLYKSSHDKILQPKPCLQRKETFTLIFV